MNLLGLLIRHTHHYGFRCGEWAEVLGVGVHPDTKNPCFHVRFIDGVEDYWAIKDESEPYEFQAMCPKCTPEDPK